MKNLQEMSLQEMKQVEGGFDFGLFFLVLGVVALVTYLTHQEN